jgi:hypothetical protein
VKLLPDEDQRYMVVVVLDPYSMAGAARSTVLLGGALVCEFVGVVEWMGRSVLSPTVLPVWDDMVMIGAAEAGVTVAVSTAARSSMPMD